MLIKKFEIITDPRVDVVFENYPDSVRDKMMYLRQLIIETAEEIQGISKIEETLKWGEPSFIVKNGSTLRMDWKEKTPNQYAMYFSCSSRLIDTFRLLFANKFKFEGSRAIVFQLYEDIPIEELKACIKATLTYHKVKHLITLGI